MVFDISMRKRTARQIVLAVFLITAIILNLAFIWVNSSKVSTESSKASRKISETIVKKTVKNYDNLPKKEQNKHIKNLNTKIRSLAHFAEFIPLGLLLFLLVVCLFVSEDFKKILGFAIAVALALSVLSALVDEIHQIFVKGRAFEVKDILTDSLGAFLGIVLGTFGFIAVKFARKSYIHKEEV